MIIPTYLLVSTNWLFRVVCYCHLHHCLYIRITSLNPETYVYVHSLFMSMCSTVCAVSDSSLWPKPTTFLGLYSIIVGNVRSDNSWDSSIDNLLSTSLNLYLCCKSGFWRSGFRSLNVRITVVISSITSSSSCHLILASSTNLAAAWRMLLRYWNTKSQTSWSLINSNTPSEAHTYKIM